MKKTLKVLTLSALAATVVCGAQVMAFADDSKSESASSASASSSSSASSTATSESSVSAAESKAADSSVSTVENSAGEAVKTTDTVENPDTGAATLPIALAVLGAVVSIPVIIKNRK